MSKGAGRWAALVATSFLVHGALTINSTETALWNAQGQQGSLLVQDVVNAIAGGDKMETVTIECVGKEAKAWDYMKVLEANKANFRAK